MIRIIQGNPGSGKSYYAVNYLAKFGKYDPLYKEYLIDKDVVIITNIEGFRAKHINLDEMVQRFTLEKFFTVENFEKIIEKYKARHVIVIIDEAQKYFDSKYFDKDVFYFFQYHRHLGIDIFLCTQSVSTIARHLIPLCEFIVNAQPRSKGIAGVFRYKFTDCKGAFMYSTPVRKRKEIFSIYQSFTSDEAEKPKNVITYYLVMAVVVLLVAAISFKGFISSYTNKGRRPSIGPKTANAAVPSRPLVQSPVTSASRPTPNPALILPAPPPAPAPVVSRPVPRSVTPSKKQRSKPVRSISPSKQSDLKNELNNDLVRTDVDTLIVTGSNVYLGIDGRVVKEYENFDREEMTAMVKPKYRKRVVEFKDIKEESSTPKIIHPKTS